MHRAEEDVLVLEAQKGSEKAFSLLYRHYYGPLVRYAWRLLGDRERAQDVVQDAWVTIARKMQGLRDVRAFRAWAYRSVRWRAVDMIREKSLVSLSDISEPKASCQTSEQGMTPDQLQRAIAALPQVEGEAVYLFYLEELTAREIAAVLKIPTGTVKTRLMRARSRLRQYITGAEND